MNAKSRQISLVKITNKERVEILVTETVIMAPDQEGGESREIENTYPMNMGYKPHKDFMEALLCCRPFALDLGEFSREDRAQYTVHSLKISGNMELENSRVSFILNKYVKRTGKNIKIAPGEAVMYGDGDGYKDAAKMAKAVEKVIEEAWKYINGKNGEKQLCLAFNTAEEEPA
jgi:hypothetical protein